MTMLATSIRGDLRRYRNLLKLGTGAVALVAASWAVPALAQSTASQLEEIIVTGTRQQSAVGGLITAEQAPKARSTVTQEFMETQPDGQSVGQLINLLPGVNFTSEDPYGNSGGNIRLRGFDGSRISLTWDGIPLNDTGNYATYFNQTMDAEVAERIGVNLGTTDVDSPTPSAIGGTINIVTRVPDDKASVMGKVAVGSDNYRRFFTMVDTGELGPYKTKSFIAASYTDYDKFKGSGEIEKKQINGRIYQPLRDSDFVSVAFHYNENRKNFIYRPTKAEVQSKGWDVDYSNDMYVKDKDTGATILNTNYYGLQVNPSNTGNIRGQSKFTLSDSLTLTVDPYIQYTLANGGGTSTAYETGNLRYPYVLGGLDRTKYQGIDLNGNCSQAVIGPNGVRLIPNSATGAGCAPPVDKDGKPIIDRDGNPVGEKVVLYSPSNTNTWRPGVTTSLVWDINDTNRLRFGYTLDYGRHRQTGEFGYISNGTPENLFSGKKGTPVYDAAGNVVQKRDRYSIAQLNQVSAEYTGKFIDDALRVTVGARAPFFKRELNNFCYAEGFNAGCVYGDPAYVPKTPNEGGTAPFRHRTVTYNDVLPNLGVAYRLADDHMVYASYARGYKLPGTDSLYNPLVDIDPETTDTFDAGYRYQGAIITSSIGGWYTLYKDRIDSVYDEVTTQTFDQNIGDVNAWGIDAEIGAEIIEDLTWYVSGSYNHSRYQDNVAGKGVIYQLDGKHIVETPTWQFGSRVSYSIADFTFGAEAKYVGKRYATHVNDESVSSYTTVDLDVRYDLDTLLGTDGASLKFNVDNLFDKNYFSSINQTMNATGTGAKAPTYYIGSPRTITGSLTLKF